MEPVGTRRAARALLVAPGPQVLLVGGRDPSVPAAAEFWIVPGGGMSAGETLEEAARREVWEETGVRLDHVGSLAWVRHVEFHFVGSDYSQDEYFFVRRHRRFEPRAVGLTESERLWVTGPRWWSLADIEQQALDVHPPSLAALVREWLASGPPPRPRTIL